MVKISLKLFFAKVIDPRKSPFLPPTSCLVVAFDVKLTDACWASDIYQVGRIFFFCFFSYIFLDISGVKNNIFWFLNVELIEI